MIDDVLRLLDVQEGGLRSFGPIASGPVWQASPPDGRGVERPEREVESPANRAPVRAVGLVEAALESLDLFNRGILLLDVDGRVRFTNRAARTMLNRGHGFAVRKQRLTFASAAATAALDTCLEQGAGSALLKVHGPNPSDGDYRVLVTALDASGSNDGFCVFIHEPPGKQRPLPLRILRDLYGLSAAEARLANALFVGQSLQVAAGTVGVSIHTAKSVLKRVFVKCEVRTQAALLQSFSLGPRAL